MLAFRSIRFLLVALAGGAIAQEFFPSLDAALAGQLGAPIADSFDNNAAAGAEPVNLDPHPVNPAPAQPAIEAWAPPNTEPGNSPALGVFDPNAAAAVPPAPNSLSLPDLLPQPVPAPGTAIDPLSEAAAPPLPIPATPIDPIPPPPAPFDTLIDAAAPTTTISSPTDIPLSADTTISTTTTTKSTQPIASGLSWAASSQPTTLQTITTATATRPGIPLFTHPGGSKPPGGVETPDADAAAAGNAVGTEGGDGRGGSGSVMGENGDGEGKEQGQGEVAKNGPQVDFVPTSHWVLPLNWNIGAKGNRGAAAAKG